MDLSSKSRAWLADDVFPLWREQGIDSRNGSFIESLTRDGKPLTAPRRAMVQARQIYSFCEGARMGILPTADVQTIVGRAIEFFISKYSLPSGGFAFSVDADGKQVSTHADLYTQAFAMFGMAEAFHILQDRRIKDRALQLLKYLQRERRISSGGFSELVGTKTAYEANPHMHLYEAAIAWMKADGEDERWLAMTEELDQLGRNKFIDSATGTLSEHFHNNWQPIREDGNFVWEPGHHFEWAWLMVQSAEYRKRSVDQTAFNLFKKAEEVGRDKNGFVVDEVWSNGQVKKGTSRFWPQGERVKAAVQLGVYAQHELRPAFAAAADQGLEHMFTYFEGHKSGLWGDVRGESGELEKNESVKASSLYHIINAIAEYTRLRGHLG